MFLLNPTECSPEKYPAMILNGLILLEDGKEVQIPQYQFISSGWGIGQSNLILNEFDFLPIAFKIQWLSFVENTCYFGGFDLSPDTVKECYLQALNPGFDLQENTVSKLNFGLSPKGFVSVWIQGKYYSKEIFHDVCKIDPDFNPTYLNPRFNNVKDYCYDMVKSKAPQLFKEGAFFTTKPPFYWTSLFRKDITSRITIPTQYTLIGISVFFLDGQQFTFEDPANTLEFRRLPKEILIVYRIDEIEIVEHKYFLSEEKIVAILLKIGVEKLPVFDFYIELSHYCHDFSCLLFCDNKEYDVML